MNELEVAVRGNIVSDVKQVTFEDGNVLTSFRMACNVRKWGGAQQGWVDLYTNFYTVNCRRGLGSNVMTSLTKGNPVLVRGRVRQQRWAKDGRNGENSVIEADAIGHDLTFGCTDFRKVTRVERVVDNAEFAIQGLNADVVIAAEDEARARGVDPTTGEVLDERRLATYDLDDHLDDPDELDDELEDDLDDDLDDELDDDTSVGVGRLTVAAGARA